MPQILTFGGGVRRSATQAFGNLVAHPLDHRSGLLISVNAEQEHSLRISISNDRDAFTTIAGYKLSIGSALFFRCTPVLDELRQIAGLTAVAIFRGYDFRSLMVYAQWEDRAAAEAGVESVSYKQCMARFGDNTFATTLCDVVFLDDARPVCDHLDAVLLEPAKDKYVTLIGTFNVKPERRDELLSLLQRDTEFLCKFDGFVSVAFHRAVDRDNVLVELLQFQSSAKLRAVSKTPSGAAHLAAVNAVGKVSSIPYRLSGGFEMVE